MFTLMISASIGLIVGIAIWFPVKSIILSISLGVIAAVASNALFGRRFYKIITSLMESVEKDIKADRIEIAIEKLKDAYKYSNWQLLLKKQLDSQIGSLLYARKRFDEALPYLKNSYKKSWPALCMLASYHYKTKEYGKAYALLEKVTKDNKKDGFPYSLYAYMLMEQGQADKALSVLNIAAQKMPKNEKIQGELEAVRNKKKLKMQSYGAMWLQMHLGKSQEGAKQYQMHLMNQRVKRR